MNYRISVSKLLFVTLFFVTILTACQKAALPPTPNPPFALVPSTGDISLSILIDTSTKGLRIPSTFTGLSFEMSQTASGSFFATSNTSFINLIKNLGTNGILRIGANSCDNMIWKDSLSGGSKNQSVLYKDYVDRYFKFAQAVGWKSIFGLNAGTGTPTQAVQEVQYIIKTYANNLLYFEIGNEPDLFHDWCRAASYGESNYLQTFDSFYTPLHAAVPTALFEGPATSWNLSGFTVPFINSRHANLSMLTHHYYYSPASSTSATATKLLGSNSTLVNNTNTLVNSAKSYKTTFRWTECNSFSGGGAAGISNTLASALWGADFMFSEALLGCAGVNFHGGGGIYTPIAYAKPMIANPLYYGMLAFKIASQGVFLKNTQNIGSNLNCNAYTVLGDDGKYYITIINKDQANEAFVRVTGLPINKSSQIIRLDGGGDVTATSVTLGNAVTDANGNWTNVSKESAGFDINSYQVEVPKASVALLIVTNIKL